MLQKSEWAEEFTIPNNFEKEKPEMLHGKSNKREHLLCIEIFPTSDSRVHNGATTISSIFKISGDFMRNIFKIFPV